MSDLRVDHLHKSFGRRKEVVAVEDVSFAVSPGEMLVLVGPSGCGKTTTLRCLAGLEVPDQGTIAFGQQQIFDANKKVSVPIHKRDIGLVFQNYALWPHLSGWQNVAFPLKSRWVPREERRRRIEAIAEAVDLDRGLLDKRPSQLSGGQQQRVALARALVAEPKVVLFDEPLSNLDAALREQLRSEIRRLHDRIGFTGVYVTHDLSEAMLLGDRVAAMSAGKVVQCDSPNALFHEPENSRVARLMGYRCLCTVSFRDGAWNAEDCSFDGPIGDLDMSRSYEVMVRPASVALAAAGDGRRDLDLCRITGGLVASIGYLGADLEVFIDFSGRGLRLLTAAENSLGRGSQIDLTVPLSDVRLFDVESGARSKPGVRLQVG